MTLLRPGRSGFPSFPLAYAVAHRGHNWRGVLVRLLLHTSITSLTAKPVLGHCDPVAPSLCASHSGRTPPHRDESEVDRLEALKKQAQRWGIGVDGAMASGMAGHKQKDKR